MPFDGVVVKCLAAELNRVLTGARIRKISQPDRYDLYIDLSINKIEYRLLLSSNPSMPRAYLSSEKKENPAAAPSFCMLLRKHLKSGYISGVSAVPYERAIFFEIRSSTELGDPSDKKLIIEIMGKYSNIILLDENDKIIDSIKHVDFETSRLREVMPARNYSLPPPQNKIPVDEVDPRTFFLDATGCGQTLKNYIIFRIMGFSAETVLELTCDDIKPDSVIKDLSSSQISSLVINLDKLKSMLRSNIFSPCLIYTDREKTHLKDFYCLTLNEDGHRKYSTSMSFVLDSFYSDKSKKEYISGKYSGLLKTVNSNLSRLAKKEKIHLSNIEASSDAPIYRLYGELIISNMYRLKNEKANSSIRLENYYDNNNNKIEIPLNQALSLQKNAEAYFKKSTKSIRAKEYSITALKKIKSETEYLRSILFSIENCESLGEIEEIRQELQSQNYIRKSDQKKRSAQKAIFSPFHYISSEAFNIYIGKNNLQNDYLTLKAASSKDIWLHVKDYPGSHVIIRYEGKAFTDQAVLEGSMLAAYYSKARSSENVSVDHTFVKNVKRHVNKKPGMVYYTEYKTTTVTPDIDRINALMRKE